MVLGGGYKADIRLIHLVVINKSVIIPLTINGEAIGLHRVTTFPLLQQ